MQFLTDGSEIDALAESNYPDIQAFAKKYKGPGWPEEYARIRVTQKNIGDTAGQFNILRALKDPDPDLRQAVIRKLQEPGMDSMEFKRKMVLSENTAVYEAAQKIYGPDWLIDAVSKQNAVSPQRLVNLLQSKVSVVRDSAQAAITPGSRHESAILGE